MKIYLIKDGNSAKLCIDKTGKFTESQIRSSIARRTKRVTSLYQSTLQVTEVSLTSELINLIPLNLSVSINGD